MTPRAELLRFHRVERWVHWSVGALTLVCIATAAILYNGSLAVLVGNRHLVELVHVYSGFGIPIPLILGLVSRAYRRDLQRLDRFVVEDWKWLRSKTLRLRAVGVGKFNAGQKLNGALSGGSILVLLLTGTVMFFPEWSPLNWRTGATFVHDWFALAFGLLVVGHIFYAFKDSEAMRGMRGGSVLRAWAENEHPEWAREVEAAERPVTSGRDPEIPPRER
ncbi:formate dehydrogenase [Rhodococcus sp. PAMC28707]|uniref:cytochrome b/b6 domain-containing protein n=1 Tax=unclassified Rhodococcus (in: high G+C Gram-positive bacteria) TaxID=192944 RepID=UPI00109D860B|nr:MULTISPECIES: cytochrome b/b6 domain-containing protein [unclassified Rhodococcus (in: high G+C Gram-positive bacteria)]QCB48977.1 formate dehydrogenase [Rhodococcus sp. PAMC28705]QCB59336.1 formate dehydrogenase [Rhodococcus sp. PAMC28707]